MFFYFIFAPLLSLLAIFTSLSYFFQHLIGLKWWCRKEQMVGHIIADLWKLNFTPLVCVYPLPLFNLLSNKKKKLEYFVNLYKQRPRYSFCRIVPTSIIRVWVVLQVCECNKKHKRMEFMFAKGLFSRRIHIRLCFRGWKWSTISRTYGYLLTQNLCGFVDRNTKF